MAIHRMDCEVRADQGKIIYTCPICDRCVEIDSGEGAMKVLVRGDQNATHRGGALADIETEVEQWREPPRQLH